MLKLTKSFYVLYNKIGCFITFSLKSITAQKKNALHMHKF